MRRMLMAGFPLCRLVLSIEAEGSSLAGFGAAVLVLINAGAVVISGIAANRPRRSDLRAVSSLPESAHFPFFSRPAWVVPLSTL